jgi:hypothetical protein
MIVSRDFVRARSLAVHITPGRRSACVFAQKRGELTGVWSVDQPDPERGMSRVSTPGTFEECADELNDFINTLERYPHTLLAFVLRAHLSGLLQALVAQGLWTREEVATFLGDMEQESLHTDTN